MSRSVYFTADAVREATHILLRGLPRAATSRDVRRAIMQAGMKGVSDVSLYYNHFRPTGKAILTMALPDYTRDAIRKAHSVTILGTKVEAEPIYRPESMLNPEHKLANRYLETTGDGASAGVAVGSTVSLCGLPGRAGVEAVQSMVKGFELVKTQDFAAIQRVPLPEKKFSMITRWCIHLESESEAQRLVRKLHMTPYKGKEEAPIMRAEIIY
ncbi:hypothetical protein BDZ97DRAFT_290326 [Flammula alnicola]|nr:hypothetical protein BDZ97DRAFT_290326 [Flammula alnicola]